MSERGPLLTHALSVGDTGCGDLVALAPAAPAASAEPIRALMAGLADCINDELRLTAELDSMAQELTERYEELNLVYHIDGKSRQYASQSSQVALMALVRECAEHLDLEAAVLHLPEDDLEIAYFASDADSGTAGIWRGLKHELLALVRSSQIKRGDQRARRSALEHLRAHALRQAGGMSG